jgi:hypothetical protein
MTKIEQHRPTPPSVPQPTHNSGTIRTTPAGGKVSTDQYQTPKNGGGAQQS